MSNSSSYKQVSEKGEDLSGKTFGKWEVLGYLGKKQWKCRCLCDNHTLRNIKASYLRSGRTQSCGCEQNRNTTIIGEVYGEWEVIDRLPNGKYICKCSCGIERSINRSDLTNGKTKSCGHATTGFKDLTGKVYEEWEVLEYIGNSSYNCRCSCGEIRSIRGADLISHKSKSCGHNTNKLVDIQDKTFGEWKVLRHVGYGKWECQCSCGTIKTLRHTELIQGDTTSCGCKQSEKLKQTMIERYSETCTSKLTTPRTLEQIDMVKSKESLRNTIDKYFDTKPTIYELAAVIGLQHNRTIKLIHIFELEDTVDINPNISKMEKEVLDYVLTLIDNNTEIEQSNRVILSGQELDIYIPSLKLAVEFNGTYWHSSIYKSRRYHQLKTIDCAKQGIHLVHIFEYEWKDRVKREIIKSLLSKLIVNTQEDIIQARKCKVVELRSSESKNILDENHLQGYIGAEITLGLEVQNTGELIGVMSFGKPRYTENSEWELLRLVWKHNIKVIGGAEKLFKAFIKRYNPQSIISYCNISKFNGSVYLKLGFKATAKDITDPNYVWVDTINNKVMSRYQTQKHKLIANGIGIKEQTENEIMDNLGYIKVYDSGNLKFTWKIGSENIEGSNYNEAR